MTLLRAVAVASAALAMPGAAIAAGAAGWSSPQAISRPHDDAQELAVAYTAGGRAVASWRWLGLTGNVARHWSMAAQQAGRRRFAPERELPDATIDGPHVYGRGRVLVATRSERNDGRGVTLSSTLGARFGDVRGRFGALHVIQHSAEGVGDARLAVNARGAAVLIWTTYGNALFGSVYISVRPPGGAFGRPQRLGPSSGGISAAVGPAGDALVAWGYQGIRTRFRTRGARSFHPVDRVRSEPAAGASLYTAVTPDGSALVGWFAQTIASGGTIGIPYIQLARRPSHGHRFGRALLLARGAKAGGRLPETRVSFAAGPGGTAGVAWASYEFPPGPDRAVVSVRVALVEPSGAFAVEDLARTFVDEQGQYVSLAFARDGEAAVAWSARSGEPGSGQRQAYVSRRPAHGAWSAPERVAAKLSPAQLAVSYPPRGGPLTLLFSSPAAGSHRDRIHVITRAAG